jgi:hypothetical protein
MDTHQEVEAVLVLLGVMQHFNKVVLVAQD